MRMVGIGLMGFLLAGIALLLSTMNVFEQGQRYIREATTGPQLVFEHRTPATAQDAHKAVFLRSNPDHPVILSGFPAYQSVAFIMPVDARPTSGYLQIDATLQVLDGVEGVLRISIHNTRRGEMLLRSGEVGRSLQIPLSSTDFAGDQLVVSFSLLGTGPHLRCGPQDGVEAVVEIETTSAIHVTLDRPELSTRDQVHAWGNVVRVAWPEWLKQEQQLRRLLLATEFQRRGLATTFAASPSEPSLKTTELRAALAAFPVIQAQPQKLGHLAQTGANAGLRRFHRQVEWREWFTLGAGAGQHVPSQLDLHILFGQLIGDRSWSLTVTLNKRLVFQQHIAGTQTNFQALIDLPADIQATANTLEMIATTTTQHTGLCDQGPELIAELLPSSQLIAGNTPFVDPLSQVQDALRAVGPVSVAMTSTLSAIEAHAASRLLAQVIPAGIKFKPARSKAHITALSPGHPMPPLPDTGPVWLITHDNTGQDLSVIKLRLGAKLPRFGLALLVAPGAGTSTEAEG